LRKCEEQLGDAVQLLEEICNTLHRLDIGYIDFLLTALSLHPLEENEEISFANELDQIQLTRARLLRLKFGLIGATGAERKAEGRSRPRLPFLIPTLELMELWESITEQKVVSPKGMSASKSGAEAVQPSTEFIRLGLTMIEPTVTLSNVFTSIKNAIKFRREHL